MESQKALTLLLLLSALAIFFVTDPYFAVIEDETIVISAARLPLGDLLGSILQGSYRHEHPPLPDLLLHAWLPIGGSSLQGLRLPSVVFFLSGLLVLAFAARKLAGQPAFMAAIAIGLLWPFAFHFARLAGWYSLCFLLVATLTLLYLEHVSKPRAWVLAAFTGTALLLVYTNYYGWAVIACLAIDFLVFRRQPAAGRTFMIVVAALAIGYLPLWPAFIEQIGDKVDIGKSGLPLISRALNAIYTAYSLFVSESVAPWFWLLSVPAAFGIVATILSALSRLSAEGRRFLGYFALLLFGMSALGISTTKRLLGIAPWLILPLAVAVGQPGRNWARIALPAGLAIVAAIGWFGTVTRGHYASAHFIEPWKDLAGQAATVAARGGTVISNSPSFLFEMNYALRDVGLLPPSELPGWVSHPSVIDAREWADARRPREAAVLFVRGVNASMIEETEEIATWLEANCKAISSRHLVPDSGYELKRRFFEGYGQRRYRIDVREYDCTGA